MSATNKPPHANAHRGERYAQKDRQDEFTCHAAQKRDDALKISHNTSNTGADLVDATENTLDRIRIDK
jgi:hypothetical protein